MVLSTTTDSPPATLPQPLSAAERALARDALRSLRHRGLVVRGADLLTSGVASAARFGGRGLGLAPGLERRVANLAESLLSRALNLARLGLSEPPAGRATHALIASVMASGAAGGLGGLAGFVPDATLTTLAILRGIAGEAMRQGEDLAEEDTRRACLEVFLLGGPGLISRRGGEDAAEPEFAYYTARLLLRGRPLSLLLSQAASRYGMALSQKLISQSVPILGAASGAALNAAFFEHYRKIAKAHFVLRRIERIHGGAISVEVLTDL